MALHKPDIAVCNLSPSMQANTHLGTPGMGDCKYNEHPTLVELKIGRCLDLLVAVLIVQALSKQFSLASCGRGSQTYSLGLAWKKQTSTLWTAYGGHMARNCGQLPAPDTGPWLHVRRKMGLLFYADEGMNFVNNLWTQKTRAQTKMRPQLMPCIQSSETLSREPSYSVFRQLTYRN